MLEILTVLVIKFSSVRPDSTGLEFLECSSELSESLERFFKILFLVASQSSNEIINLLEE